MAVTISSSNVIMLHFPEVPPPQFVCIMIRITAMITTAHTAAISTTWSRRLETTPVAVGIFGEQIKQPEEVTHL